MDPRLAFVPIEGPFGAFVDGLDLSQELDRDSIIGLVDGLYQHRILVFRDQHPTRTEYVRFGREWGDPIEFFVPGARTGSIRS